jgi:zeaxanthin glucosyltransferase
MTHFGILCPPTQGHLNPNIILGKELKKRGNKITFLNVTDCKEKVEKAGLSFITVGSETFPKGSLDTLYTTLGQAPEHKMIVSWNEFYLKLAESTAPEIIETIRTLDIDMLIIDQIDILGGSIAEFLDIPFINVCNTLPTNFEKSIPSQFTNLQYDNSEFGLKVNEWTYSNIQNYFIPIRNFINEYRSNWGLPLFEGHNNQFYSSSLAQIAQIPKALDFPRKELEQCFHYTAPFRDDAAEEKSDFPYHLLDGRPIIYASLGTLVNHKNDIFKAIAEACYHFDYQLIMAVSQSVDDFKNLPGNPLVMKFVPQNEILKITNLLITHAGVNTVLDAITNGVPMIAIPITFDQPGCAERVRWNKIGEVVPLKQVSAEKIKNAILKVTQTPEYRQNIKMMQSEILQIDGKEEACNIIEEIAESVLVFA